MANTPQAKKRIRQNERNRKHNASRRSNMRTVIKQVKTQITQAKASAVKTANLTEITEKYRLMTSTVDKAAKDLIHPNKAARIKKRLAAQLKALQVATSA